MNVHPNPKGMPIVVYGAVDDTTVIAIGDAVCLSAGKIIPAASITWDTNLATTQVAMVDVFLGVAMAAHANGGGAITDFPVDVSPFTEYRYSCTSETHEIGDTLGMKKDTGNALLSNALVKSTASSSCFRCSRRDASAATTVYVRMQSAFWGHNAAGAQ